MNEVLDRFTKFFRPKNPSKREKIVVGLESCGNRVRISPDPLFCPVCYCAFASAPVVLRCGHSFCRPCIGYLIKDATVMARPLTNPTYQCPLCRVNINANDKLVKNYALESIMTSVMPVPDDAKFQPSEVEATHNLIMSQLKQQVHQTQLENTQLKEQLANNSKRNYMVIALIVALILKLIF
uniref:RING-type domain-containing protein n=1 Tax=Panagrellus redivivus TaxID=6233 RepID=A0A7E4VP47_PANRE